MEQVNYVPYLPKEPPEGLIEWMRSLGCLNRHALIYKAAWVPDPLSGEKERMVRLKCSACGGEMYAARVDSGCCASRYSTAPFGYSDPVFNEGVISGQDARCPICGESVRVYHVGDRRGWIDLEVLYPMTVDRVGDKVALLGWCVKLGCDMEGREKLTTFPYEAYVLEERKVVRLVGYQKILSTVSLLGEWEQRKTCVDNWGEAPLIYPWDPAILSGTTAENCKLDLFLQQAKEPVPVTYLRLWLRHPNIENLVTAGCGNLVNDMIRAESRRGSYERAKGIPKMDDIFWKEKRPSKMLGLTAVELHWCALMGWNRQELDFFRWAGEHGVKLKLPEDMRLCQRAGIYWCYRLVTEKKLPLMRCVRYLLKQKGKNNRADCTILEDYWRIAQGEGVDLNDDYNRFPPDLMKAHDRVVAAKRAKEAALQEAVRRKHNDELRGQFAKQFENLKKMAWACDGIIIRPAEAPEELEHEGEILHHCVGNYKNKHAEGKSAIFFIRREIDPDKPWFTLELNLKEMTVIQNRGKGNCAKTAQVQAFEDKWLAWLKAGAKKKKKEVHAA